MPRGEVYIDTQDPYVYAGSNSLNLTYLNMYTANSVSQVLATVVGQTYGVSSYADAESANTVSFTENGPAVAGLANYMCILAGFPTVSHKVSSPVAYPFGLLFANATTLYAADEGDGVNTYTAGLRNNIGTVAGDRVQGYNVVIWATSSTVSGSGDQGADPNKIYLITDRLSNTSAAFGAQETFTDLRDANSGEVLRGTSFTPGTPVSSY